jgi:hypothetical protein
MFIHTHPGAEELFHADKEMGERTDMHNDVNSLFSQFLLCFNKHGFYKELSENLPNISIYVVQYSEPDRKRDGQ